ncbi:MAG: transglycosylase domain-containing protein, partial [Clostridia bacterium]|nr:transglycosylase domain-containing protein [Clostridia bacterium]
MKKKIGYVLLTFMLTAFLCALIIAVSLYFYLSRESDSEVDIVSLADAGGATTIIYLPDGETELYRLHSEENRISVSSDEISDNIKKAFVAIEDHRFYT